MSPLSHSNRVVIAAVLLGLNPAWDFDEYNISSIVAN
jgi:hypothetical protein